VQRLGVANQAAAVGGGGHGRGVAADGLGGQGGPQARRGHLVPTPPGQFLLHVVVNGVCRDASGRGAGAWADCSGLGGGRADGEYAGATHLGQGNLDGLGEPVCRQRLVMSWQIPGHGLFDQSGRDRRGVAEAGGIDDGSDHRPGSETDLVIAIAPLVVTLQLLRAAGQSLDDPQVRPAGSRCLGQARVAREFRIQCGPVGRIPEVHRHWQHTHPASHPAPVHPTVDAQQPVPAAGVVRVRLGDQRRPVGMPRGTEHRHRHRAVGEQLCQRGHGGLCRCSVAGEVTVDPVEPQHRLRSRWLSEHFKQPGRAGDRRD
jgi:hypothetical protein